ncbi:MAG: PGN_0703 family putative restriction endonuclease [Acidimicrobiia bacterium]
MDGSREVLADHDVLVAGDSPFQRRARLLQALWREDRGYPIGAHRGRPLGSRLPMPEAEEHLWNYLTEGIRGVVRDETRGEGRDRTKVYQEPRIFEDLLSSQPLCFNLFGELVHQRDLASDVGRRLWPGRVEEVTRLEFEWSPGRDDPRYLANRSAFDVYLEHTVSGGGRGFIGIEVKYHENLKVDPARHQQLYEQIAALAGVFVPERLDTLLHPPCQQLWLDHLLALSILQRDRWDTGLFVLLHPSANLACTSAWSTYGTCLESEPHAEARTLEELVDALGQCCSEPWVRELAARYLDFNRVAAMGV